MEKMEQYVSCVTFLTEIFYVPLKFYCTLLDLQCGWGKLFSIFFELEVFD